MYSDDSDIDDYYNYMDDDDYDSVDDNGMFVRFEPRSEDEKSVSSGPRVVESLLDLSAKTASRFYSYSYVEHMYRHIPEPVAKKLMLWSFPRSREDLVKYFGTPNYENDILEDVMQIGFQVSGSYQSELKPRDVSLYFDRCVITSASCSCTNNSMLCRHVISLAHYRLKKADTIPIHLPISDSLNPLNREQLLYLVKFIINKHSNILLYNAQTIANELLDENSEKNAMPGAPDPTAGGDMDSEPVWLTKKNTC